MPTDQPEPLHYFPVTHIAGVSFVVILLLMVTLWPSSDSGNLYQERRQLTLPEPALDAAAPDIKQPIRVLSDTVQPGDSLSVLFGRNNLSARDVINIAASVPKDAIKLRPGQTLQWTKTWDGHIQQLDIVISPLASHRITRSSSGNIAYTLVEKDAQRFPQYASAVINTSLFYDGGKAGVPQEVMINLAGIFGWDVDFALDIRTGDSFSLVYEEIYLEGEKIGNGDILAARFVNRGKSFTAIRFVDKEGNANYYTPKGLSMRKEFLRNPIDFARISSRFNLRRKHPVLNKIRAHKGTDYAAARGTPIKSAGDGKVIFAGRKGGYGNVIIIQHGTRYQTLYAHMNNFHRSIRRGRKVKQGQIIGYVGSTGLATGPHLHYEFRVDGVHRDSLRVKLPKAKSLPSRERPRFMKQSQHMTNILDSMAETP